MVYEMEWANKLVHFMRFSLFKKPQIIAKGLFYAL